MCLDFILFVSRFDTFFHIEFSLFCAIHPIIQIWFYKKMKSTIKNASYITAIANRLSLWPPATNNSEFVRYYDISAVGSLSGHICNFYPLPTIGIRLVEIYGTHSSPFSISRPPSASKLPLMESGAAPVTGRRGSSFHICVAVESSNLS